jgi:NADH:ubiquinone oxidoreductase subunit E
MSVKKVHDNQPKDFKFSDENLSKAEEILKRYPAKNKKSAVMPFVYALYFCLRSSYFLHNV